MSSIYPQCSCVIPTQLRQTRSRAACSFFGWGFLMRCVTTTPRRIHTGILRQLISLHRNRHVDLLNLIPAKYSPPECWYSFLTLFAFAWRRKLKPITYPILFDDANRCVVSLDRTLHSNKAYLTFSSYPPTYEQSHTPETLRGRSRDDISLRIRTPLEFFITRSLSRCIALLYPSCFRTLLLW